MGGFLRHEQWTIRTQRDPFDQRRVGTRASVVAARAAGQRGRSVGPAGQRSRRARPGPAKAWRERAGPAKVWRSTPPPARHGAQSRRLCATRHNCDALARPRFGRPAQEWGNREVVPSMRRSGVGIGTEPTDRTCSGLNSRVGRPGCSRGGTHGRLDPARTSRLCPWRHTWPTGRRLWADTSGTSADTTSTFGGCPDAPCDGTVARCARRLPIGRKRL